MRVFRFGEFVFDTNSGELRKGSSRTRLRPQPAVLLAYFLQHTETVVTRDELRRLLWPDGTYVQFDHGLNSCIKQIRAALSDERLRPRYLETLPRRGYRFTQAVVAASSNAAVPADFGLSGTVRVTERQLHVEMQLYDAADEAHVWTSCFTTDLNDALDPRRDIGTRIIDALVRHASGR
ncbi:MAG: winged helix-turn-helix domain-containing protein [Acidobacteria bacterium]|nr:winged helix-turn-helix domain-containing protein [Acidobacteriota bacterium]